MKATLLIFLLVTSLVLTACGGGGSDTSEPPTTAATPTLSFIDVKGFKFDWTDVNNATFYRLMENPDGVSGFTQVGEDITDGSETVTLVVSLFQRLSAQYLLQSCNDAGCIDSSQLAVSGNLVDSIGYFKASNTGSADVFGASVSLSSDGTTLAVGASQEGSNATGVNGDSSNNDKPYSGAVYVFTRSGVDWVQQAYIKASNTDTLDFFGGSISLSADGDTLAIAASFESSDAIGINGDEDNNEANRSGAVYVFTRTNSTWSQQAYVKASNTESDDKFGTSISISGDGNSLAVGARGEKSSAGVNGDESNNSMSGAGAVYVYLRNGDTWEQQAYVKASNTGVLDYFGTTVSLDESGELLAVGAKGERSNSTGVNNNEFNDDKTSSGAVYVFNLSGDSWVQQAYIKASNTDSFDEFGTSISISADGSTLAIGTVLESSNATGVDGDESNNDATGSGAVYVFESTGSSWTQQAYVKASNSGAVDHFGHSLSLSGDGNILVVGADEENGNAIGLGGNDSNDDASSSGSVYVFNRSGSSWLQNTYVKSSNTEIGDNFGDSISLSIDGNTLAVGAPFEDSNATGVGGDESNNILRGSGAVYVY
ncbi:MAG: integrin [Gammaproteobacteria bacterium]|nr:integrin [Gammaproteobacteria bacterium]